MPPEEKAITPIDRDSEIRNRLERVRIVYLQLERFLKELKRDERASLSEFLMTATREDLQAFFEASFEKFRERGAPVFVNKGGVESLKYLLYWLLRSGGQELENEVKKFRTQHGISTQIQAASGFLAERFISDRKHYSTFEWKEVEGTVRERIKRGLDATTGHGLEALVRFHVETIIESKLKPFFPTATFHLYPKSLKVTGILGKMDYDVVLDFQLAAFPLRRIYFACKGRGTTGGGHAGIFTRDLMLSSLNVKCAPNHPPFILAVVVAEKWEERERKFLESQFCDFIVYCKEDQRKVIEAGKLPDQAVMELEGVLEEILRQKRRTFGLKLERFNS